MGVGERDLRKGQGQQGQGSRGLSRVWGDSPKPRAGSPTAPARPDGFTDTVAGARSARARSHQSTGTLAHWLKPGDDDIEQMEENQSHFRGNGNKVRV